MLARPIRGGQSKQTTYRAERSSLWNGCRMFVLLGIPLHPPGHPPALGAIGLECDPLPGWSALPSHLIPPRLKKRYRMEIMMVKAKPVLPFDSSEMLSKAPRLVDRRRRHYGQRHAPEVVGVSRKSRRHYIPPFVARIQGAQGGTCQLPHVRPACQMPGAILSSTTPCLR
ncbi:uncharacterized protein BO80DRAFT_218921 [Aspergillus ibericus CBS 121593]|uniref:Uncharacterized protein n=1 Tax=Aspergillus ibericus CBS 121593 TaxID=1448316 RepID=A0A395GN22_9EURO|nr:hypothetical protein BO80DRAFT_218921 [Aspergillus ibericus CBS 121593]RAK96726.1 hypothetical protein BO80DRAFT_218921 [Aspergillus ibericus CBS 121593]